MIKRILLVCLLAAPAVQAQTLQQQMSKCLAITGTLQRLACYDGVAHGAGLTASAAPRAPMPAYAPAYAPGPAPAYASAPPMPATPAQQFGSERLASTMAQVQSNNSIHADIVKFDLDLRQKFTVTLSNGQVWRQIEGDDAVAKQRRTTHSVTIARAVFGSYALTFNDTTRIFKVTRVS